MDFGPGVSELSALKSADDASLLQNTKERYEAGAPGRGGSAPFDMSAGSYSPRSSTPAAPSKATLPEAFAAVRGDIMRT